MKKAFTIFSLLVSFVVFSQKSNTNTATQEEGGRTPENQELFRNSISKIKSKNYSEAIVMLNQLALNEPKSSIPHYYLAQAYFLNKQYTECSSICTEGLKIEATNNLLHLYRAYSNKALGKTNEICDDVKKSFTTDESLLNLCK